jgi:hypothetical protein
MNDNAQNKQPITNPVGTTNLADVKIQPITDQETRGLKFTGITIKVKLPLKLDTGDFMFGINTDGFIPQANLLLGDINKFRNIYTNLLPVQVSQTALNFVSIEHKFVPNFEQMQYMSNRFNQGSVGVVVRLVSNVGQTGHLVVSHITGVQRIYYVGAEKYQGLRFRNMPTDTFAGSLAGFSLVDISTNRNLSLISTNNPTTNVLDFNKKISFLSNIPSSESPNVRTRETMESQFLEDWLIFGPTNSMPNTNGGDFELSVYFDYSRVTFFMPLYPMVPTVPQERAKQILLFSKTFDSKTINSIDSAKIEWSPGYEDEDAEKQLQKALKYLYHIISMN